MAPLTPQDRAHPSSPPQSIPLRDLSRPPDTPRSGDGPRQHNRGRSLLSGGSRPPSGGYGPRYERLDDSSPSPTTRASNQERQLGVPQPLTLDDDDGDSAAAHGLDPLAFQAAMGFEGFVVPDISVSQPPRRPSYNTRGSDMRSVYSSSNPYEDFNVYDNSYGGSDSDRIGLTDAAHLQPISGAQPVTPDNEERTSFTSIRFHSPDSRQRKLGDDLPNVEAGRGHKYGNSLSPHRRMLSGSASRSGALTKAGSIVRAMSQRVVNISNEAEIIEASARREVSPARSSQPPPLPQRGSKSTLQEDTSYRPESIPLPPEKTSGQFGGPFGGPLSQTWQPAQIPNPLKGNTLFIFSPENKLRNFLCDLLVKPFTEPIILFLIMIQTAILAIEAAPNVYEHPRSTSWGGTWIDYALLGLFVVFTLELLARIIVSGFFFNALEYSTLDRQKGVKAAVVQRYRTFFTPQRQSSIRQPKPPGALSGSAARHASAATQTPAMTLTVEQEQRRQLARRAFLRHSFNRLDFVAVISYWLSFGLSVSSIESGYHLYLFQMLSCLRILRLLAITNGTSIILRSLKKATPLLVNVAFLICFFWLIFAIIGVQSFKSSFDRSCVWVDPNDQFNLSAAYINTFQFCGGQLNNDTGAPEPWQVGTLDDLLQGASSHKGYLCPRGSYCLQLPTDLRVYNGTVNFDNIFQSLELVFVVISSNTFSDLMYYTTNSDYLAAALFFAGVIMIMMLWLMNLLIAVITSSFQIIREESKTSAFASNLKEEHAAIIEPELPPRVSSSKRLYDKSYPFWILVITFGLVCESMNNSTISPGHKQFIDGAEVGVTFLLLIEIFIRFFVDWRGFIKGLHNWFDLGLAVITTVILLPPIRNSGQAYAWLTVFQILRIYRVVMAVQVTRTLITLVLGNASGIGNLVLFVFLITFLISIFAVQLFRGDIPEYDGYGNVIRTTFFNIYNAFLGMYQVLSSENWTALLYSVTSIDRVHKTGWIGAIFFIGWFILANFILVNMFIAVIQENFDVSEDEKRLQQVKAFLHRREIGNSSSNISLSTIFRLGKASKQKDPLDYGPATMEMLLKDAVVQDFLDDEVHTTLPRAATRIGTMGKETKVVTPGLLSTAWGKLIGNLWEHEPNPFYSNIVFPAVNEGEETNARTMAKEAVTATTQRKRAQREYLARHPKYNTALFIFRPSNPIRRLCQRIVGPGRGSDRYEGVEPNKVIWYTFSAFIYAVIVAMVLLACVTTPLYQKEYFNNHIFDVKNWFVWTDMAFAIVFTVEALIKVVADGFFWTPNAYFRSTWGFIDGLVLVTLWINVITSLLNDGAVSRAVGAFKALRALRLLNVSDSARETFHSLILVGGVKVLSAAFVSMSLLIPFAIYGVNLFNGQMEICNDTTGDVVLLSNCIGEWDSTPFSNSWPLLAPRVAANPYYNFDEFGSSLFILFQIVSQEGWIDVMWSAQSIVGRGIQPRYFASQGNAVFFVIFNLLATVFILTLFISVFMRNYTEQTGMAFLTSEQRSWLELRKLLRQVSPSKRPSHKDKSRWKDWCYKRSVRKHGKWHQTMTLILVLHLILLLVEYYPEPTGLDLSRDYVFLAFTIFYIFNIVVRIIGLSWARFSRSSWDLYAIFAVSGTFATTVLLLSNFGNQTYVQLHKLFLVSIVLLLIPRNDSLDQLFKTAAASFTSILNLLATWFVLYLVFAIAMTQTFGLTRFGSSENDNLNFRTVPKALILLFRMSCGEGWNQIMADYASIVPPLCTSGDSFFDSDCGSPNWARALFISWNILSMYIFTSLFVSLIYESFSYVYQHSSGLGKVSRDEIRRFKQAWATFDPTGTGFIPKETFPRLLGELSGMFEMRIYPHEQSVRRILEDIQSEPTHSGRIASISTASQMTGVNLRALNARLAMIDPVAVRQARARYNLFYEEVMVSADPDRGVSFTGVLMILAHYKIISDNKSLKLEEFLRRRARLQRVEEEIRRRIVVGFFDTLYWSRKFRAHVNRKKSGVMTAIPELGPEVFVEEENDKRGTWGGGSRPPTTLLSPFEDQRESFIIHGLEGVDGSPGQDRLRPESHLGLRSLSPNASPRGSPRLSPHKSTVSNLSIESADLGDGVNSGASSRRGSASGNQNVLDVLDDSVWGESLRRSFTQRRPSK